jgi:hypothetical protein
MWQVLNRKAWFDQPRFLQGKVPDKSQYDDLLPFHAIESNDLNTKYWRSLDVRDWTKLHYSYDDFTPQSQAIIQTRLSTKNGTRPTWLHVSKNFTL